MQAGSRVALESVLDQRSDYVFRVECFTNPSVSLLAIVSLVLGSGWYYSVFGFFRVPPVLTL